MYSSVRLITQLLMIGVFVSMGSIGGVSVARAAEIAVYPLQITQPQPNLTTTSRYYKAYPGIPYKVPVGVFGGAFPFTYALTVAPTGMTIDADGVITWPNPTTSGSPHAVTVQVVDAAGTSVTRSWTITVTTEGFIFVDATRGTHAQGWGCSADCGTGTLTNPFRSMGDFYQGTTEPAWRNAAYDNYFVYWRGGTYGVEGFLNNSGQQAQIEYRGNMKPHVWLAYPGEAVIMDFTFTSGMHGAFLDLRDGDSSDFFVQGMTFRNMLNHAFRVGGYPRTVFFDNRFENLGPGADGQNSSFIMYAKFSPQYALYPLIKNNVFAGLNTGAFIKTYSTRYLVVDGNSFSGGRGGSLEGVALKNDDQYVDVRGNIFEGGFGDGAINGNWNNSKDFEIRFNKILHIPARMPAITVNHDALAGVAHIHRNTLDGALVIKFGVAGNGPFRIYDNVIINDDAGVAGSHISYYSVADTTVVDRGQNLVGTAADAIIDAHGDLTSSHASHVGTRGYQVGVGARSVSNIPIPPPVVPISTPAPSSSGTSILTATLYQGVRSAQVKVLQELLISKGYLSSEYATGYYGTLTTTAVKRFQCENDIICSGTPATTGYGMVGKKTRAVFNAR